MAKDGSSGSRGPRTVADATRFTPNTPHAKSKATPAASAPSPSSSSPAASRSSAAKSQQPKVPPQTPSASRPSPLPNAPRMPGQAQPESVEDRVRRLRAAHLAARQHKVSRFDQVVGTSRRFFDAAHKFTVMGLIGFSGLALLVTVYATGDMILYNRKRRSEFFALQQHIKEGSFEEARLAYIGGTATEEQIAIVDEATEKAQQAGMTLPALLSSINAAESQSDAAAPALAPAPTPATQPEQPADEPDKKSGGIMSWLFRDLQKEETRDDSVNAAAPAAQRAPGVAQAVENKAKAAFEQEKENQRTGGPLDQLGLDSQAKTQPKKTGWFW